MKRIQKFILLLAALILVAAFASGCEPRDYHRNEIIVGSNMISKT